MEIPTPPQAMAAFAAFVRDRLADVSGTLLGRRDGVEVLPAGAGERAVALAARQLALVIVGAAAPFASTSYARTRLLRQLHASGLLSAEEAARTARLLELGAPR